MQPDRTTVPFSSIVFDEGLYPRVEGHDPSVVQTYARDMEQIEAAGKYISLNADNVLLDGRHRMLAYKKRADGQTDFDVQVLKYSVVSPLESFSPGLPATGPRQGALQRRPCGECQAALRAG